MLRKSRKKNLAWVMLITVILGGCGDFTADTNRLSEKYVSVEANEGLKEQSDQLRVEDLKEGEKYQITLGYNPNIVPQCLEAAIVDFNKSNPYYEVVIKEYDWQTGQQRLEADLVAGNGPDLFDLSMIYVDSMVQKGVIEDLSPYLEDGQGIERKDLVESVLACNTREGVLTCVPHKFCIDIMLGKKSLLGERSNWTIDEFLKCVEENEGMQIANGILTSYGSEKYNRYSSVYTAIYQGLDHFIDEDAKRANFDCEEFRTLLNMAKGYQADAFDYQNNYEYTVQVRENELLLYLQGIASVNDFVLAEAALGEDAQFIGFPTYDGSNAWGISNYISCGMNANSRLKEGAWAFLEFLLTYEMAGENHGFYTYDKLLEEQFISGMEKSYMKNEEGERIELPVLSYGMIDVYAAKQEDIDALREMINGASYVYGLTSNSIYQIVQEEVLDYLDGKGSTEECIELIQNRVQLYLDEQN